MLLGSRAGLLVGGGGFWRKGGGKAGAAGDSNSVSSSNLSSGHLSEELAGERKSGSICHLQIVLNKLQELLRFEVSPFFPIQNMHS